MIKFNVNEYGPLVTDVFLLGIILHFVVLFMSFILLIKHYFIDQGAIGQLEEEKSKLERGFVTVRSNRKRLRIEFDNLLYVESMADYIKIHLVDGGEVISKEKISHLENELPGTFIRIHRSFIVNREKITSFNREEILLGETELPVSRSYRSAAISELGRQ
jgi:two-component system response regulator LytT